MYGSKGGLSVNIKLQYFRYSAIRNTTTKEVFIICSEFVKQFTELVEGTYTEFAKFNGKRLY